MLRAREPQRDDLRASYSSMNETNERLDTVKNLMLFLEQRDAIQHEHSIRDQKLGRMLNEIVGFDA